MVNGRPFGGDMRATSTAWRTLPTRRNFERRSTWVQAVVHFEDKHQSIIVRDVARGGIKIEFAYGLTAGDEISIELMSGRFLQGTVAWSLAAYCGVAFHTSLAEDDPVLTSCKRH
jgi:PilZ domain